MIFDFIVVGGGLAASVVSNRLLEQDPSRKILVVEAGPDANCDASLIWPNATNTIGGTYDWNISSVPQVNADNRNISLPVGKALGGGTVINSGKSYRSWSTDNRLTGAKEVGFVETRPTTIFGVRPWVTAAGVTAVCCRT